MKRLVSTLNLTKEDWLRYRKCGITGTDAGAILGLNPYRSAFQVYHDKISDTVENIDNEAMRQGRDLEEYVAQRFTEATGLKVRRANAIYQSEEHPLLLADFDRLIVGQKAGLECKTVSPFSADKWADGKIPAHYLAQVDHYLAVSGFDCWYVAALIFGRELVMLAKMIDKIVSLKETKIFEINGQTYADASLTRIPPHVDRPDCISVSGLDSICKLIRTELEKVDTTIMVQVKSNDTVEVMTTYLSDFSRNTLYRAKADAPGLRTGFRGREVALIELRSLCIPNEGTAYLLDLLSRMTNENSVSTNDNGVTQTVEARQGVALNAVVEIKPRVMLRPFRTFLEVEQPESEFLLRVDPDEGIGFFEADGGIWKLEAKKNIADYFLKNMGDLIDAGKVVVMQ